MKIPIAAPLFAIAPAHKGSAPIPPRARQSFGGDDHDPRQHFDPRRPPHEARWIELREFHALLAFL